MNTREQEKHLIELRRSQVYELHAKGFNNTEISKMLSEHVSQPTVSRDLAHLKRQAGENIRNYIDHELPNEYQKTLVGLTSILKEAWTTAQNATGRDRIQALELAQKAYQMRLELLTNATVVESAVKFVEGKKKQQQQQQPQQSQEQTDSDSKHKDLLEDEENMSIGYELEEGLREKY